MSRKPITKEYRAWQSMKTRCFNDATHSYAEYGARGITVCDRWKDSYETFFADMGTAPSLKHSVDRRDNNGPYSKENCHWATAIEQQNNTRATKFLEWNGHKRAISEWGRLFGATRSSMWYLVNRGMGIPEIAVRLGVELP